MEFLASVFREGQHWHDQAGRLQQENATLKATLTAREQQERLDWIELEARLASVAASAEKETRDLAEAAFAAKTKEKKQETAQLKIWLDAGQKSWNDQEALITQLRQRVGEHRRRSWTKTRQ